MYLPNHFKLDKTEVPNFITNHPFATLISVAEDAPVVNYAPLLFDTDNNCLIGHLANSNAHLELMNANPQITVIFHGPDSYISPNWYKDKTQVPTWNFTAVEIRGNVILLTSTNDKLQLLEELSTFHESRINSDWAINKVPAEKFESMLKAITGFKIEIKDIKGKAKLSQNKSLAERSRVIEGLKSLKEGKAEALAELMIELT